MPISFITSKCVCIPNSIMKSQLTAVTANGKVQTGSFFKNFIGHNKITRNLQFVDQDHKLRI